MGFKPGALNLLANTSCLAYVPSTLLFKNTNLDGICQACCVVSMLLAALNPFSPGIGPTDAIVAPFREKAEGTKK